MRGKIFKNLITGLLVFLTIMAGILVFMPVSCYAAPTITVVIDPGHGGPGNVETDRGASYNGIVEKDINLITARALKKELEQYGNMKVYMTRNSDKHMELKDRVNYAKSVKADLMVAVHYNASGAHNLFGSEIFVPSKGSNYQTGFGVATKIMEAWGDSYGDDFVNKGIKTRIGRQGDYYGVIRFGDSANIPVLILEHSYIDNNRDLDKVDGKADYERWGALDAKGIAGYYGLGKKLYKAKITPTVNVKMPAGVVKDDTTGPINVKMTVDSYNIKTGEVKYTMYAEDPESRVMFFGASSNFSVGSDLKMEPVLDELNLWGSDPQTGTDPKVVSDPRVGTDPKETGWSQGVAYVSPGYEGPFIGQCFNNYNFASEPVSVWLSEGM